MKYIKNMAPCVVHSFHKAGLGASAYIQSAVLGLRAVGRSFLTPRPAMFWQNTSPHNNWVEQICLLYLSIFCRVHNSTRLMAKRSSLSVRDLKENVTEGVMEEAGAQLLHSGGTPALFDAFSSHHRLSCLSDVLDKAWIWERSPWFEVIFDSVQADCRKWCPVAPNSLEWIGRSGGSFLNAGGSTEDHKGWDGREAFPLHGIYIWGAGGMCVSVCSSIMYKEAFSREEIPKSGTLFVTAKYLNCLLNFCAYGLCFTPVSRVRETTRKGPIFFMSKAAKELNWYEKNKRHIVDVAKVGKLYVNLLASSGPRP